MKPKGDDMRPDHKSIFAIWRLFEAVRREEIKASDALRAIAADERVQELAREPDAA